VRSKRDAYRLRTTLLSRPSRNFSLSPQHAGCGFHAGYRVVLILREPIRYLVRMTNVEKLKRKGVIKGDEELSVAQKRAVNALSDAEVHCLISVKKRVPRLGRMRFNRGCGGIF
jgi:hypothetical protein